MRLQRILLALAASAALAGCATDPATLSATINAGDTLDQVRQVMGPPQDRHVNGPDEAWQYCGTGAWRDGFVAIFFRDGKVTRLRPYNDSAMNVGSCTQHFKAIQWGGQPDIAPR